MNVLVRINEKSYQYELIALPTNKEPTFKEKWYNKIISKFLRIFNVNFSDHLLLISESWQQAVNFQKKSEFHLFFNIHKSLILQGVWQCHVCENLSFCSGVLISDI